eukprot:maker-scaffold131_size323982-snap-gene-2.20 protein:Tk05548 transcript:maker-scaffold131_size323982-snap-gene-2.20-mRNA-1 annotation:"hypothetical protein EIN_287360"
MLSKSFTWIVLLVLCGLSSGIKFNRESNNVLVGNGQDFTVTIPSSEPPDFCKLLSPRGKLYCSPDVSQYVDAGCDQLPSISITASFEGCTFAMDYVDANTDYGSWTVTASSFGAEAKSTIFLTRPVSIDIEMENTWGILSVKADQESSFLCSLLSEETEEFALPTMVWKVGEDVKQESNKFDKIKLGYTQNFKYTPDVKDSQKKVSCSFKNGDEVKQDFVELHVYYFEDKSASGQSLELDVNKAAVITKTFKFIPRPQNIEWEFDTPNGIEVIKAGEDNGRLSSSVIKDLGYDMYEVEFRFKRVIAKHDGQVLKLRVIDPDRSFEMNTVIKTAQPQTGRPPMVPQDPVKPPMVPQVPDEPQPDSVPVTLQPSNEGSDEAQMDGTTESGEVSQAGANINLMIIVGILALLICLCVLYYCCKCKANKKKKAAKAADDLEKAEEKEQLVESKDVKDPDAKTVAFVSHDELDKGKSVPEAQALAQNISKEATVPVIPEFQEQADDHAVIRTLTRKLPKDRNSVQDEGNLSNYMKKDPGLNSPRNLNSLTVEDVPPTPRTPVGSRSNSIENDDIHSTLDQKHQVRL